MLQASRVGLFPHPPSRSYVECPRCHSRGAYITYERVQSRCSFCPECQYLWDTLVPADAHEPAVTRANDRSRGS
jgi:hypothetical protein